jgi:uncharacterized membrane protein
MQGIKSQIRRKIMSLGPVELLVVQFSGTEVKGDIVPAIKDLVEKGTIRIIDILFIQKDQSGKVTMREINDLDDASFAAFNPIVSEIDGLVSRDDIQQLAATLNNNSSAGVMLFEDTWAVRLRDAITAAQGKVVLIDHIPQMVIEQALAAEAQA